MIPVDLSAFVGSASIVLATGAASCGALVCFAERRPHRWWLLGLLVAYVGLCVFVPPEPVAALQHGTPYPWADTLRKATFALLMAGVVAQLSRR